MGTRLNKMPAHTHSDCVVVGAGPAGLALAIALAKIGKTVTILERQQRIALSNPNYDGRDIAITHGSRAILKDLGIWPMLRPADIHPAKGARVLDGVSPFSLTFNHDEVGKEALGHFVSNHAIRKAAYDVAGKAKTISMVAGVDVRSVTTDAVCGTVMAADGRIFSGDSIVAADGRFSPVRRMMGVATNMRDFGRVIVVARMRHEKPHHGIAYECFHYGRTLAILPLGERVSSVVITVPTREQAKIMAQNPDDFAQDVEAAFDHRLGKMSLVTERYSYPLVAVHAASFVANRFALLGDAAVGMHPVTAHGYNLGLRCVAILQEEMAHASSLGLTCGDASVLDAYNRRARQATWPIYCGTNFLVGLFNDTRPVAKIARKALLRIGQGVPPLKHLVTSYLAE